MAVATNVLMVPYMVYQSAMPMRTDTVLTKTGTIEVERGIKDEVCILIAIQSKIPELKPTDIVVLHREECHAAQVRADFIDIVGITMSHVWQLNPTGWKRIA